MPEAFAIKLYRHRRSQVRRDVLCLACCLSIALLGGCSQEGSQHHSPLPVKVQPVKLLKYAPKATLTGEIIARVQSDLSFRVRGRIIERKVDVGSHVHAGEVLARLD